MLEQAAALGERAYERDQWFIPDKSGAEVYGTVATAKSLCGCGLLEYRVYLPAVGKYSEIIEYRITDDGRAALHTCHTIAVSSR